MSNRMRPEAARLEAVFKEVGIKAATVYLADEHDFDKLSETLLAAAAARDGQSVALNVTGGTKLMALAAQSIAQAAGWSVYYVDLDTDCVTWLPQPGTPTPAQHPLTDRLRLRHYLKSYGFELAEAPQRPPLESRHHDYLRELLTKYRHFEDVVGQFNGIADRAEKSRSLTVMLTEHEDDSRRLAELIEALVAAKVLTRTDRNLKFVSESERDFAKGGWLEHHVFNTVTGLTGKLNIRDRALNVVVTKDGVQNELDVALLARNRLFVIECKTGQMKADDGQKANDALFKLAENCRRVGGIGTRGMLVTYRTLRESERRLGDALGIKIVAGDDLARLSEFLRSWIAPAPH